MYLITGAIGPTRLRHGDVVRAPTIGDVLRRDPRSEDGLPAHVSNDLETVVSRPPRRFADHAHLLARA